MIRAIDKWLLPYLRRQRGTLSQNGPLHIMLCVCDHFEPYHDARDQAEAVARVMQWSREFPRLTEPFQDADGTNPAHTFFTPIEQYDKETCAHLADLCQKAHAEVEIHLHHDRDTANALRQKLDDGKMHLMTHGFLPRVPDGSAQYAFIHGDWALDDSHPTGRHCGVRNELEVLQKTGCYADFTMPAAPNPCQTKMINSIYYATDTPARKSHDKGTPLHVKAESRQLIPHEQQPTVGEALPPENGRLLMIQGPLGLNWRRCKWGILPRLENAELSRSNPPTALRMELWLNLHIHVSGCPDWVFIKLHTHGGIPNNFNMLLGEQMQHFYQTLSTKFNDSNRYCLHYVTARELVNIVRAAENGETGNPGKYRDFVLQKPPLLIH